jgi:hypothetical protein
MEIHFQPSIFNDGKDFFISSRDEVTQWELVSTVEKRFRDAFVPTEDQQDPEAAFKAFVLSKKTVERGINEDQLK